MPRRIASRMPHSKGSGGSFFFNKSLPIAIFVWHPRHHRTFSHLPYLLCLMSISTQQGIYGSEDILAQHTTQHQSCLKNNKNNE
jgi:hypothetical protein